MKNKTCGECRFFESKEFLCCHSGDEVEAHFVACFEFEPMTKPKLTNGDKIRQMSSEELATFLQSRASVYPDFCTQNIAANKCNNILDRRKR